MFLLYLIVLTFSPLVSVYIVFFRRAMPFTSLPKAISVDEAYRRQLPGCRSWFASVLVQPASSSVLSVPKDGPDLSSALLNAPNARTTKGVWDAFFEEVRNKQWEIKYTSGFGVGLFLGPSAQIIPMGSKILVGCHVLVHLSWAQHEYLKTHRRDISVYMSGAKMRGCCVEENPAQALLGPKSLINASCGKCATVRGWEEVTVCKKGGLKPGDQVLIHYAPEVGTWKCPSCGIVIKEIATGIVHDDWPNQPTTDSQDDSDYQDKPPKHKKKRQKQNK